MRNKLFILHGLNCKFSRVRIFLNEMTISETSIYVVLFQYLFKLYFERHERIKVQPLQMGFWQYYRANELRGILEWGA